MAGIGGTITVDGKLLRYGETVLNRVEVCEANLRAGVVLMRSGSRFEFPPEVVQCWFADVADCKPPYEQGLLTGVRAADLGNGHHA